MKRVLFGAVMFVMGSASAPKAANENETLTLLCQRFETTGGATLRTHEALLEKAGRDADRKGLVQPRWNDRDVAIATVLRDVRAMVCGK